MKEWVRYMCRMYLAMAIVLTMSVLGTWKLVELVQAVLR
jgi:hypothetical protein